MRSFAERIIRLHEKNMMTLQVPYKNPLDNSPEERTAIRLRPLPSPCGPRVRQPDGGGRHEPSLISLFFRFSDAAHALAGQAEEGADGGRERGRGTEHGTISGRKR